MLHYWVSEVIYTAHIQYIEMSMHTLFALCHVFLLFDIVRFYHMAQVYFIGTVGNIDSSNANFWCIWVIQSRESDIDW